MKINNETKVGILTAIAISLFIMGFNFLKGKSIFKTGNYLFAKYTNTKGVMISNAVLINGYKVGTVYEIESEDANLSSIVVTIKLNNNYNIPKNSLAIIKEIPLASPSIEIKLGSDTKYLQTGDTIMTADSGGLLGSLVNKIGPISDQLKVTMGSLDSVLNNLNSTLDPDSKNNLKQTIANINAATSSLVISANAIQTMLNAQSGSIAQSMNNVNSITKNLADNNEKITKSMENFEKTTEHFANADIDGTVASLKKSIDNLNNLLEKVSSKEGTIGLLMNDKALYNNLTNTIRSSNILIDDLKMHPKRYVNVSVFGKKDKSIPLKAPLNDSSINK